MKARKGFAAIIAVAAAFAVQATSLKWDGGGDGVNFSDPLNWEGDIAPAAGSDSYRLEFNGAANGKSLVNDIAGLAVTNVTFGSNATSPVTISGQALTDCVKILNSSTAHHIFECEVVCRSGTTPDISRAANNYIEFSGGLAATTLPTGSPSRWCGKITMENTDKWGPGRDADYLLVAPSGKSGGTVFTAKTVDLNWFKINNAENVANTAKVEKAVCDGASYRYKLRQKNWSYRWYLVADTLRAGGVLKVGEVATTGADSPDLFHSYADSSYGESGIIEAGKITNGGTTNSGEADTINQRLPYIWLNRGFRGYNSWTHAKPGTWAIGPGGLTFTSDCDAAAKYRVGANCGALLKSFDDWTLAAQGRGAANTALQIDSGATLEINTDHYVTGDETAETPATHKVTLTGRVGGAGGMLLSGGGEVVFDYASTYSGGTTVTNGATLAVNNASRPGSGAVKMERGTTLLFPKAGTGTTAEMGAIVLEGDNTVVFSNLTSGVTAATAASLTLSNPATTTFAIEGDSVLAPGFYTLFKFTGGEPLPDISNITLRGAALEGVEYETMHNDTFVSIYVPGAFECNPPQMVKSGAMSDASNWLGGVKPSTETLNGEIVFLPSVTNAVNDIGVIPVSRISIEGGLPVVVSGSGKFTEVAEIDVAERVHHEFQCAIECESGTAVAVPTGSDNYPKFTGGLKTQSLAFPANLSSDSVYYMGDIEVLTTDCLWDGQKYAAADRTIDTLTTRVVVVSGSNVRIPNACLNWVKIEEGATVSVSNLTTSLRFYGGSNGGYSSKFMVNYNTWYSYWTRVADECSGTLRILDGLSFSGYDCFMPNSSAEGSIVVAKGINNASTAALSGAWKGRPYVNLSQGYRAPVSGSAAGREVYTGAGRIALGSGGLKVVSGANSAAKFFVGYSSTIYAYEDWALAAHGVNAANVALYVDSGVALAIDTAHYTVGDPEIDDGAETHVVTFNGKIAGAGSLNVTGGGRLVMNAPCAADATIAVAAQTGATLELTQNAAFAAGTVGAGDGGTLFCPSNCTVAARTAKFDPGATFRVAINATADAKKLTVSNAVFAASGYDIKPVTVEASTCSGLQFDDVFTLIEVTGETKLQAEDLARFRLSPGAGTDRRLELAIEDGNLVAKVRRFLTIRIAEKDFDIPAEWIDAEVADWFTSDLAGVAASMTENGANGIPRWQSYCLGLEPGNAESVVLCEAAESQPGTPGEIAIRAKNVFVPAKHDGVTVVAQLDKSADGVNWSPEGSAGTFDSGAVAFNVTMPQGETRCFFRIRVVVQ